MVKSGRTISVYVFIRSLPQTITTIYCSFPNFQSEDNVMIFTKCVGYPNKNLGEVKSVISPWWTKVLESSCGVSCKSQAKSTIALAPTPTVSTVTQISWSIWTGVWSPQPDANHFRGGASMRLMPGTVNVPNPYRQCFSPHSGSSRWCSQKLHLFSLFP